MTDFGFYHVACDMEKRIILPNLYLNIYRRCSTYFPSISIRLASYRIANSLENSRSLSDYLISILGQL